MVKCVRGKDCAHCQNAEVLTNYLIANCIEKLDRVAALIQESDKIVNWYVLW